jgi:hypothetical protein
MRSLGDRAKSCAGKEMNSHCYLLTGEVVRARRVDRIDASRFDALLDFLLLVPQLTTIPDLG